MGLATLVTALWIDIPLEAVMLKISDGMDDFALLTIPFFVLAGAIMSEGGVARRLVDLAKVFVGFIRGGLALVNVLASTLFGCLSGSSVADTASIGSVMIPQMVKNGYSEGLRHQRDDLRLGAGDPGAALAQLHHLLDRHRRHRLDRGAVHGGRFPGPAVRRLPDRRWCCGRRASADSPRAKWFRCARRSRSRSTRSGA